MAVTGLSLPGAAPMTLVAGVVFGRLRGTAIVSCASTPGATATCLVPRLPPRDAVRSRFARGLRAVGRGIARDGAFSLLTLRLMPALPVFVIRLVTGRTPVRTWSRCRLGQLGMPPGTRVYVNAGTRLARVDSVGDILSSAPVASFTPPGWPPRVSRRPVRLLRARQALRGWPRPRRFDRDLVVIGAGSAGLVTAYVAAATKAKVSLVERGAMGGDCLNTGCVPSKALLRTTRFLADARRATALGLRPVEVDVDFAAVMQRVRRVIARVAPHDSVERYTALGVDVIPGEGRITSPYTVEVDGRSLSARGIVVATGAQPAVPPIPGIEDTGYLTSETVWDLRSLPRRLLVLGGGPIGCELAQAFARLGSRVTIVERGPRLLPREDPELAGMLAQALQAEGVDLRMEHEARAFQVEDGARWLVAGHGEAQTRIGFDALLVAVGRRPRSEGLGLEELGVPLRQDGTIEVNEFLQTRYPSIYAAGDVTGPLQLTHFGAHQAWYAAVNALFGGLWRFAVDYSVIPRATFTDPEIARVGLNEQEAREREVDYEVTTFDLGELDRAIADEAARGLVKVLTVPGRDRILGVTIAGAHAGELIAEHALAMRHGLGLNKILRTVHTYPTMAEANKYVAGQWRRAHAPEALLRWLARYHRWKRGR